MARPEWQMPSNLGTVTELVFYERVLEITNPTNENIEFSFLSGDIPPGLQVVKSGMLQGVPVILDNLPVDETRKYTFAVRARTTSGTVVDKTFIMTVSNVFPPIIVPKVTLIDHVFDGTYFRHQLRAIEDSPTTILKWSLVNGQLPPGIELSDSGLLDGYIRLQPDLYDQGLKGYDSFDSEQRVKQRYDYFPYDYSGKAKNKSYVFTVQVTDGANTDSFTYSIRVANKALFRADQDHIVETGENIGLTVDNEYLTVDHDFRYIPIITTPAQALPTIRQDNNFAFKFDAIDFNDDRVYWSISVADGSGFDQNGSADWPAYSVTGFLFFTNGNTKNFVVDRSKYHEEAVIEITNIYLTRYELGITGSVIEVIDEYVADEDYAVTNGGQNISFSIAPNPGKMVVEARITYPLNPYPGTGVGFDTGLFDQSESRLPPDLQINADGWLYGYIEPQIEPSKTYQFIVTAYKDVTENVVLQDQEGNYLNRYGEIVDEPVVSAIDRRYESVPVQYSLTILGDNVDLITWTTPSDLGSVINGSISELKVEAVSNLGKVIHYRLLNGETNRLPQGVQLLDNGLISGRVSFRYFAMDSGDTTFDRDRTLFDNRYQFTVEAITDDGAASTTKEFTVRVDPRYNKPYENLYFKAFPQLDQREIFDAIMSNQEIFPDELIYRKEDPWFGKAKEIKFLEMTGLDPASLREYALAIEKNHYWKRIDFGAVKTAVAVDEFYRVKYEVVYVEIVDPNNTDDAATTEKIDFPDGYASYLENNFRIGFLPNNDPATEYRTIYPNSFSNFQDRLISNIGYYAEGIYPDWMTSVQPDKSVIGFRRAVVLAYTVPGASKLMAYRLKNNGIQFNQIEFILDRYQLDNHLSQYYDTAEDAFLSGKETTFDKLILGPGDLDGGVVDYAVEQSFDSINNRTVAYLRANGGIDGVTAFADGDLLVFAQQENYSNEHGPNQGWIDYQNFFMGDLVDDGLDIGAMTREPNSDPTGFDLEYGFDSYSTIPGYWEKLQTNKSIPLSAKATANNNELIVPYVIGDTDSYVGKLVTAYSGVQENTRVDAQSLIDISENPAIPELYTKLTLNKNITVDLTKGSMIDFISSVAAIGDGQTTRVRIDLIPADLRIGSVLSGAGVPEGAVVTAIENGYIYSDSDLSTVDNGTIIGYRTANQRGGIWRVNITGDSSNYQEKIVKLEFVQEIQPGQKIKVLNGKSNGFTFMIYDAILDETQTAPAYRRWQDRVRDSDLTTIFDGNGTRFFDKRDTYSDPGINDKYIKFPQIGVFT